MSKSLACLINKGFNKLSNNKKNNNKSSTFTFVSYLLKSISLICANTTLRSTTTVQRTYCASLSLTPQSRDVTGGLRLTLLKVAGEKPQKALSPIYSVLEFSHRLDTDEACPSNLTHSRLM